MKTQIEIINKLLSDSQSFASKIENNILYFKSDKNIKNWLEENDYKQYTYNDKANFANSIRFSPQWHNHDKTIFVTVYDSLFIVSFNINNNIKIVGEDIEGNIILI
jgi:hypothetical protein